MPIDVVDRGELADAEAKECRTDIVNYVDWQVVLTRDACGPHGAKLGTAETERNEAANDGAHSRIRPVNVASFLEVSRLQLSDRSELVDVEL